MAPTVVIFIEPRENSRHLGGWCPQGQLDGKGAGLDPLPDPLLLHPHPSGPRSCSVADRRSLAVSFTNSFLFGNGLTQALQVIEQDRKGSWERRPQGTGGGQEKAVTVTPQDVRVMREKAPGPRRA